MALPRVPGARSAREAFGKDRTQATNRESHSIADLPALKLKRSDGAARPLGGGGLTRLRPALSPHRCACPAPRRLRGTVEARLEGRGCEHGANVVRFAAGIGKAVPTSFRHDQRLMGGENEAFLVDPRFRLPRGHRQHLFDRMAMGGRAGAGGDPLFEQAQSGSAIERGDEHAGLDARALRLDRPVLVRDSSHDVLPRR